LVGCCYFGDIIVTAAVVVIALAQVPMDALPLHRGIDRSYLALSGFGVLCDSRIE